MATANDIAIVSGARTPMGRYCGALRDFTAVELAAIAGKEAIGRSGLEPGEFDHAIFGNALQTSGDALYGARHVALRAGLPIETPALTVNRLCGSGIQSIITAAQMIQLGEARAVLAGGMESMSQAPHVIRGMRWGVGLGEGKLEDSLMVALLDTYCGLYMANTAELYAGQQGITRAQMDEFALRSQRLAHEAQVACRLAAEITPVALKNRRGEPTGERFEKDDHLRPDATLESLAGLKPAFGKNGVGYGRQRQRNRRWRRCRGGDVCRRGRAAKTESAWTHSRLGCGRRRSKDHGIGSRACFSTGAQQGRARPCRRWI